VYLVAGTQVDEPKNNEIRIMRLSQLHRTRKSGYTEVEESDSDSDDDNVDEDPVLEHRAIPTNGGTNRIRVYQTPTLNSLVAASWSELGKVHIWNIQSAYNLLSNPGCVETNKKDTPIYTVRQHGDEGYGLAFHLKVHFCLGTIKARSF